MLALLSMNSFSSPQPLNLACHPQTPSQAIQGVDAVVWLTPGDMLTLTFILNGDLSGMHIPEPRPSRRANSLWTHTCFEAFVMAEDGPGYREFNFSPSGEWAVYAFNGYRDGGALEIELAPGIVVHRSRQRLELRANIRQDFLPPGRVLRLGLSAVVEDADGALSYWALRHPLGKPDFHHPDAFVLQQALPCKRDLINPTNGATA
jgi:hypothetical protein